MAQGIAYTNEEIENMLEKIKPILQTGVSLNRAVEFYNSEAPLKELINRRTLANYVRKNKLFSKKVKAWQDYPNIKARKAVIDAMNAKPELALRYLELKEKNEFSTRTEHTGVNGSKLMQPAQINITEVTSRNETTKKTS